MPAPLDLVTPGPSCVQAFALLLLQSLWLFAPLFFAGAVAAVVIRFDLMPSLRRPIDGGRAWRGARLFGDHKTWRGLLVAVVGSSLFASIQPHVAVDALVALAVVDWPVVSAPLFGALMGLGAVLGELPNSFVKRRLRIAPGKTTRGPLSIVFYVWDQVDVLCGAWLLVGWWVRPSVLLVAVSFAMALAVHPVVSLIGWLAGVRRTAR